MKNNIDFDTENNNTMEQDFISEKELNKSFEHVKPWDYEDLDMINILKKVDKYVLEPINKIGFSKRMLNDYVNESFPCDDTN